VKRNILVFLLSVILPSVAFAWGGDGHQIVCLIAEDRLTPEVKAAIHDLLGADLNISHAEIASWADEYRRQKRSTGPWHYVDIPTSQPSYDAERDGDHGNNVIDKINDFEKALADQNVSLGDRAQALKFLVHFVGDKGGNGRLVFFFERQRAVNLHSCWDTLILVNRKNSTRVLEYAEGLDSIITNDQPKLWAQRTPLDWANESHRVAVEDIYTADVPAGGDPPKLDQKYVDRSAGVVEQQLQKAVVRLATVLNQALRP